MPGRKRFHPTTSDTFEEVRALLEQATEMAKAAGISCVTLLQENKNRVVRTSIFKKEEWDVRGILHHMAATRPLEDE